MNWQPIADAPRDGTRVDIWSPTAGREPDCVWRDNSWFSVRTRVHWDGDFTHFMIVEPPQ